MSTTGVRDFRPAYHFTPEKMWMNDPNGMIYLDGKWHLFYQHYPEDTKWGPMHWGHAVSEDLMNWEHLPIALEPDELGLIFSGSAILDRENRSGFGCDGKAPIIAMYTSTGEWQQQSIAYSLDGVHFEKYAGNPVIANAEKKDFRDPKLYWNEKHQCFGVVLAAGDHVEFYASEDLKEWKKTGEFGWKEQNQPTQERGFGDWQTEAVWECPDLFPITYEKEDGSTAQKWILLVSTGPVWERKIGSRTWYFVGEFDGATFVVDQEPRLVDHGYDNYAGVTWSGYEKPVFLGWASNWLYADKLPTGEFCGQMTFARELRLERVLGEASGWRLLQKPLVQPEQMPEMQHLSLTGLHPGEGIRLGNLLGQSVEIGINGQNCVYVDRRKSLPGWRPAVVSQTADGQRVTSNQAAEHRAEREAGAFSDIFASEQYGMAVSTPLEMSPDKAGHDLEIYLDQSVLEVYADGGRIVMTMLAYPDETYTWVERIGKVKLVVFDMDGLMFDTENLFFQYYKEAAAELGYELTREFYLETVGCNATEVRRITAELMGEEFPQDEAGSRAHEKIREYLEDHRVPVKPGLQELLEYLKEKEIPCVIASSSAESTIHRYLVSAGIEEYFVGIANGNQVEHSKPEPDIFLKACADAGVRPEEALVLEDSQNGILAAWRAGIRVICVPDMKYPATEYAEKTARICQDLCEVRSLLADTR